ncbi:hypothetical protein ALT785_390039 [Alteromonas infernus]
MGIQGFFLLAHINICSSTDNRNDESRLAANTHRYNAKY